MTSRIRIDVEIAFADRSFGAWTQTYVSNVELYATSRTLHVWHGDMEHVFPMEVIRRYTIRRVDEEV